jgi:hypothetical protein
MSTSGSIDRSGPGSAGDRNVHRMRGRQIEASSLMRGMGAHADIPNRAYRDQDVGMGLVVQLQR